MIIQANKIYKRKLDSKGLSNRVDHMQAEFTEIGNFYGTNKEPVDLTSFLLNEECTSIPVGLHTLGELPLYVYCDIEIELITLNGAIYEAYEITDIV